MNIISSSPLFLTETEHSLLELSLLYGVIVKHSPRDLSGLCLPARNSQCKEAPQPEIGRADVAQAEGWLFLLNVVFMEMPVK